MTLLALVNKENHLMMIKEYIKNKQIK